MRRAFLLVILALVVAPMAGARAADPIRLTIGVVAAPGEEVDAPFDLDPRAADGDVAREVLQLQYPTLVALDEATLAPVPGIANAWSPFEHGWSYTIGDATWSDGRPVNADDVVASLEFARDEHWPYGVGTLDDLTIRKVDDRTVEVTDEGVSAAAPTLLLHVLPAEVVAAAGTDGDLVTGQIASGRWQVVGNDGGEVRLAAVDGPARPPIDEIVFRRYADDDSLVEAIATGEVDAAHGFDAASLEHLHALRGVTPTHANDGDQYVARIDTSGPLGDEDLRARVADAIDRDELVRTALDGIGRAQRGLAAARGTDWRLPETDADRVQTPGSGDTALIVSAPTAEGLGFAIAEKLAEQLGRAGFDTALVTDDPGADIAVVQHAATDDPRPVLAELACGAGLWCDATYDELFARFDAATDPATRSELAQQMLQRATDQHVELALVAPDVLQAFRNDNIDGWLRKPEQQRLVVFGPSAQPYDELTPAVAPPGEEPGNGVLVAGGIVLAIGFGVLYVIVLAMRRRTGSKIEGAPST